MHKQAKEKNAVKKVNNKDIFTESPRHICGFPCMASAYQSLGSKLNTLTILH